MSQPTLARLLARAEDELGTRLCPDIPEHPLMPRAPPGQHDNDSLPR
jgi:hypothetical protein